MRVTRADESVNEVNESGAIFDRGSNLKSFRCFITLGGGSRSRRSKGFADDGLLHLIFSVGLIRPCQ